MKGKCLAFIMKVLRGLFVFVAAAVVSVVIVSLLLCFYSILPVHKANTEGTTDYVWPANSVWVNVTEGVSFGRFDSNGFNNASVVDCPDIIIAGSSHMEATYVMQDENVGFILSEYFKDEYYKK